MPTVTIEGSKIDIEKKKELVKKITDAVKEVYGIENVTVLIHENSAKTK